MKPGTERRGWTLVWSDEFDGDRVDPAKWAFDLGNGFFDSRRKVWVPGWGNEELQTYTADAANVEVRDSVLTIRALKQPRDGCAYTSARLKTVRADGTPLLAQRYGRFEVRARVPWGKGLWPALWMLPLDNAYGPWASSGEIDLMEIVGDKPGQVLQSIHYGSAWPERELHTHVQDLPGGSTVADWHTYACEWGPGEIRFFVDDQPSCTERFWWSSSRRTRDGLGVKPKRAAQVNPWPAPFDQPFYLIMNIAVGGNFPGAPNASTRFPAELQVDHVRVWRRDGGDGTLAPRARGRLPWHKRG